MSYLFNFSDLRLDRQGNDLRQRHTHTISTTVVLILTSRVRVLGTFRGNLQESYAPRRMVMRLGLLPVSVLRLLIAIFYDSNPTLWMLGPDWTTESKHSNRSWVDVGEIMEANGGFHPTHGFKDDDLCVLL